ncbi:RusA family crossover junction endodeoxyribonuclease [Aerococcus sanguinicola]|uniref:RusA family crossover junction endodeoxyribonuclease n=1 Tax=Aerococcus TaxID=1375 RepID=UPI003305B88E
MNYTKAVLDAGNGLLFEDDSQVCQLKVLKVYSPAPGIVLSIKAIELSEEDTKLIEELRKGMP